MQSYSDTNPISTEIISAYLKGMDLEMVQACLNSIPRHPKHKDVKDARQFYQNYDIGSGLKDNSRKENILSLLKVSIDEMSEETKANYQSIQTLLPFIEQLQKDGYGHGHLNHLLKLIDQTKYNTSWHVPIAVTTFFTTFIVILSYISPWFSKFLERLFEQLLPIVLHWLERTFSILRNLPLVGMVYTGFKLLSNLYKTIFHGSNNHTQKFTALFFLISSGGFALAGYMLAYFAAGTATVLASSLFVISEAVNIVESWYTYYTIMDKKPSKFVNGHKAFEPHADQLRLQYQQKYAREAVWRNVLAAVATTAAIYVWSFFPPSIPLILGCVLFISTVSYLKTAFLERLEKKYASELQTQIQKLITDEYHLQPASQSNKSRANLKLLCNVVSQQRKIAELEEMHELRYEKLKEINREKSEIIQMQKEELRALRGERVELIKFKIENRALQNTSPTFYSKIFGLFENSNRTQADETTPFPEPECTA